MKVRLIIALLFLASMLQAQYIVHDIEVEKNFLGICVFKDTISETFSYFYSVETDLGLYEYHCSYCYFDEVNQEKAYQLYLNNCNSSNYRNLLRKTIKITNKNIKELSKESLVNPIRILAFLNGDYFLTYSEYDRLTALLSWKVDIILQNESRQ